MKAGQLSKLFQCMDKKIAGNFGKTQSKKVENKESWGIKKLFYILGHVLSESVCSLV